MQKFYKILLIFCAIYLNSSVSMDLSSPSIKKSLKEFKYQVNKNPTLHYGLLGAFAVETAAMWYVNPWISVAVNGLGFAPMAFLLIFGQEYAADKRKLNYDQDMYDYIALGRIETVIEYASKNHYQETSAKALKEQNTKYLYEVLCAYHQHQSDGNFSKANHYLRAAKILLKHHADRDAATKRLQTYYASNYDGLEWLDPHQSDDKYKIP